MHVSVGNENVYAYRYDVVDEILNGRADQGIFADHTSELYSIWGPNNTDGKVARFGIISVHNSGKWHQVLQSPILILLSSNFLISTK